MSNSVEEVFSMLTGWAKEIVNLLLALALIFLTLDLLFGDTTGIVANVADLIASFVDEGVIGLIAFTIFVLIYIADNETDRPPPK